VTALQVTEIVQSKMKSTKGKTVQIKGIKEGLEELQCSALEDGGFATEIGDIMSIHLYKARMYKIKAAMWPIFWCDNYCNVKQN
jgi:hypothetical protein